MPFVDVRGITVHYTLDGPAGAPVVMLGNSLGTNTHLWDAQLAELAPSVRVLRYDTRGHGCTATGDEPNPGIMGLADDALGLLDALGIATVAYAGLSLGGLVGQALALRAPERVRALALCATAARLGSTEIWNERIAAVEAGGTAAIVAGTVQRWFTPATLAAHPATVRGFATMIERTPPDGYALACRVLRDTDLHDADRAIAVPVLVIGGDGDPVATPALCAALRDAIPGAVLTMLPNAAHLLCADATRAFNDALVPFLLEQSPRGSTG